MQDCMNPSNATSLATQAATGCCEGTTAPTYKNRQCVISHHSSHMTWPPSPIYFLSADAQLCLAAASTGSQARNPPALCATVNFSGRVS